VAKRAGLTVVDISGKRWISRSGRLEPTRFEKRIERVLGRLRDDLKSDRSVSAALSAMRTLSAEDRRLAAGFVEGFHAADLERISEESLAGSMDDPNALRIARVSGGYDRLVESLAAASRERLHLEHIVTRLTWRPGEAVVESRTPAGTLTEITAAKVIVTVPLNVLTAPAGSDGRITFDPGIPGIEAAARKLAMGGVVRVALRFDEPFWTSTRFAKRHGQQQFNDATFFQSVERMPFGVWWTPYPLESPMLVGWTGGPLSWELRDKSGDDFADLAIRSLGKVFGMARSSVSRHVLASFTHNWLDDPFTRGAYSYVGVGGSGAAAVLARPVERTLYFAGEHASSGRNGTVDGAIASGFRAADQVLRVTR
jgi:monoamine oxidase